MKKIALGGKHGLGKFAIVDDEDFETLNRFKWYGDEEGYVSRSMWINGVRTKGRMHRIVNQTPTGLLTDHINGDTLDNQKSNLRTCTRSQNSMNQGVRKNNRLGVKGVSIQTDRYGSKVCEYIQASITVGGNQIYLGRFKSVAEASKAYNEAVSKYHGEFGRTQ